MSRLQRIFHQHSHWLALFSVIFFIATLYQRWITGDDAWFAEQAYWFAKDGYVHSDIFAGVMGYDIRQFVYHKLHVWQGAVVIWLFGWNAYYLKALPIVYIILFLFLIRHFLQHHLHANKNIFYLFIFLFFCNNLIIQHGFEYRPDIMMMVTGFISYLLLNKSGTKNSVTNLLFSGLAAGITALFHLNGLVFVAAGGVTLLLDKRLKHAVYFSIGCLIGFLPYVFEIIDSESFKTYLFQLTYNPAHGGDDFSPLKLLEKIILEPKRYFHHSYEATYLLLFSIVAFFNWRKIRANQEAYNLFKYFITLTIFVAIITPGSKTVYLPYTLPYLLLITSHYFRETIQNTSAVKPMMVILFLFLINNLGHSYSIVNNSNSDIIQNHASIMKEYEISYNDHIVAPRNFIFNEIAHVKIWGSLGYLMSRHYEQQWHSDALLIDAKIFFTEIGKKNISFALLETSFLEKLHLVPIENSVYNGYHYHGKEGYLHVFEKI